MTEGNAVGVARQPGRPNPPRPAGWTDTELATLADVAETFVAGNATRRATMAAAALDAAADPDDVRRLRFALRLLERPIVNLALSLRPGSFRNLTPAARERVLLSWAGSRLTSRRVAFQALKRLFCFLAYADPGESGTNPRWARIGYQTDPDRPTARPTPVRPVILPPPIDDGRGPAVTLQADVVVVGSGAGGGVVAAAAAEAGRSVVVVEAGPFVSELDMPTGEMTAFERLYLNRGLASTRDTAVAILAGACVGGGTTVNWATCLAPPGEVRTEWASDHGLAGIDGAEADADLATLRTELGLTTAHGLGPRDRLLLRGAEALGLESAARRTERNADCTECGSCGFGCRPGAKQSGLRVHLARAQAAGARIVADAEVRRVIIERGRAVGVEALVRPSPDGAPLPGTGPVRLVVRAPQVVMAAGALRTPAVLDRSAIDHPALGRHLWLHPVVAIAARFPDRVDMWRGPLQGARLLVEPAAGDPWSRFLVETVPAHPGLIALALPWENRDAFTTLMEATPWLAPFIAITRDRDGGRVSLARSGRVRIDYRASRRDRATLRRALATLVQVARAAGAIDLVALGTPGRWYGRQGAEPGDEQAAFDRFVRGLASWDPAPGRGIVFSAHQMGTVRAGADAASHPCDPAGRVREGRRARDGVVPGLYVADSSLFPTAIGVNPMLTVMAMARRVARTVLAET